MMTVTLSIWTRWVPVRRERTADGTTSIYFGVGRLSWRTENGRSERSNPLTYVDRGNEWIPDDPDDDGSEAAS